MECMQPEPFDDEPQETNWLTADEQGAWRAFMDGNQRLLAQLNQDLEGKHGLSLSEYRILVLLTEAPDGSLRMSELADGALSSRSRLTHQVRRMESAGMVLRSNCPEDGRGVLASLTDEGRRRLAEAAPTHVESVRRDFVDGLTSEQLRTIREVFEKVDTSIAERDSA